ncbi:hypothetical protein Pint_21832 [Pistacia integerrima]|uniref:Uncharacterized protein n=1 Tax=Pistacia integerrima TaxID=434235 RepID=A0ACC0XEJ4_9ROSI|nr:hypothetical protein Pint_21832 [Pistacia integerrima]
MAFHLLVYLQIILLLSPIKASHQKCQDICGNFRIWYPFGIGEGCYFNKWFEVTCDNSSDSPRAFLTSINMELSYGLFSKGFHYYSSQRAVVNTDGNILNDSQKFLQKLSGSPFIISKNYNMLIAFGCDPSNTSGECHSFCNCDLNKRYSCCDLWCRLSPNQTFNGGNILSNFPQLQGCTKSPFMADKEWLEADYLLSNRSGSVLRDKVVPVSLDWGKKIGRCVELFNPSQTTCNKDQICLIQLNSGDYYCVCDDQRSDYYQGCSGDLICNTTRNSNCSKCPDGYSLSPYKTFQEFQCSSSKSLNELLKRNARVKLSIIIVAYFHSAMEENRLFEVLDTRVLKEGGKEEIMKVANLTRRCLNPNGKKRPTMREVTTELVGNIRASDCKTFVVQENHREIDYLDYETTILFTTGSSSNTRSSF